MASALTREMRMMESQLNKWKGTADEALSLREKAQSLSALLDVKVAFYYLSLLYCLNLGLFPQTKYFSCFYLVCVPSIYKLQ